jgi:hypothetical protein
VPAAHHPFAFVAWPLRDRAGKFANGLTYQLVSEALRFLKSTKPRCHLSLGSKVSLPSLPFSVFPAQPLLLFWKPFHVAPFESSPQQPPHPFSSSGRQQGLAGISALSPVIES